MEPEIIERVQTRNYKIGMNNANKYIGWIPQNDTQYQPTNSPAYQSPTGTPPTWSPNVERGRGRAPYPPNSPEPSRGRAQPYPPFYSAPTTPTNVRSRGVNSNASYVTPPSTPLNVRDGPPRTPNTVPRVTYARSNAGRGRGRTPDGRGRGGEGRGKPSGPPVPNFSDLLCAPKSPNPLHKKKSEKAADGLNMLPVTNPYPLVDIGVNLSHVQYNSDREAVISRAVKHNVQILICTGTTERGSKISADIAAKHPHILYSTVGIHPHNAKHWNANSARNLRELARRPEVVAIGECGLDFDRNLSERSQQIEVLQEQIEIAIELNKPLFIHERNASNEFIEIMDKYAGRYGRICVHCFTGTEEELLRYIRMGFYIGVTGWICDERRGEELQRMVPLIPLNRLMIETDAPYLLPRTKTQYPELRHVTRNEPCLLPLIFKQLMSCLNVSESELASSITNASKEFFGIY